MLIGVTGGIGAGKTRAVRAFAQRGAAVFSADEVVHDLYARDEVRDAVRERWGERVFAPDGTVDRRAVADVVFQDEQQLRWLEGLLHPLVAREWLRFVDDQQRRTQPPSAIVAEVPLLFEGDLDERYDATVLITAPLELRLARVGDRAQGDRHARRRAEQQMQEAAKRERADFVYDNTGDELELERFVEHVLASVARPGAGP